MAEIGVATELTAAGISSSLWEEAGWLGCDVSVELPVYGFTVGKLLHLAVGSIVETQWRSGSDVPLRANRRQIAWIEFDALGESLAFRVTELL